MGIVKAGNVAAYEGSVRERAELPQHAEVIADSPALGDPAVDEPVGKRHIPDSSTGRQRISKEGSSGPVQLSGAELHHHVSFGHDEGAQPASWVAIALSHLQELAGAFQALRSTRGQRVVHQVRCTQLVKGSQITAESVPAAAIRSNAIGMTDQGLERDDDPGGNNEPTNSAATTSTKTGSTAYEHNITGTTACATR